MLVNNAGFGIHTALTDPDVAMHDRGFEVMVRAVLVLSGAAARGMMARGHGAIVNVSSTAGFMTMGSYSAMKAWVTSYTEGLAVELKGTGVTATALCPAGCAPISTTARASRRAASPTRCGSTPIRS
ncbi:MAG: SDR family NAD(P)-dependent oxidoreductase [Galbitalea sp.]